MSYLANLMLRLTGPATRLPENLRRRHARMLAGAQSDDGGFAGREGSGDLYYTSFALRGLTMLGRLDRETATLAAVFLKDHLDRSMPSIDFLSLVHGAVLLEATGCNDVFAEAGRDRSRMVADLIEAFRRDDGGYAKTERGPKSSTYHTFLAVSCKQLVGLPLEGADRIIELIRSRRRPDGGFVEVARLGQSGTNPTAAAVGLLAMLEAIDPPTRQDAVRFLASMQNSEGGLRANTRIPVADLLSTFTGLVALADLDGLTSLDLAAVRRYVEALEQPEGGFRGGAWDDAADVEYTFYGLGSLALLATLEA